MKDELGIEMCGKNCFCHNKNCPPDCATCTRWKPKSAAYKARIRELQARVQLAEHKEICVKENAEKLDAKESKVQNG